MIESTYSEVFFIYLALWLLLILLLWRREEKRVQKNEWRISRSQLFHCDNCHHTFVNRDREINICICPSCKALCVRRRSRDF